MKTIKFEKVFALGIIFILLTSTFLFFITKIEAQNRFSGSGSGTPWDPYVITNVKQLQEMKYNLSAHYVLGNDIDASETRYWNDGKGFEPIGDLYNKFTGLFDGRGYKIYNLYINTARNYVGLFGFVGGGGIIKNVGLENIKISSEGDFVGGLIGISEGKVFDCYSTGSVKGGNYVGGLIGSNYNFGTVSNSYSTSSVIGENYVGGLIGVNWETGTVSNSYSTGTIYGMGDYVGGLIGYNNAAGDSWGIVTNSYSTGSVKGGNYVGGLIGWNYGVVSTCYSTGSVSGKQFVGGLIGISEGKVFDCYSTGSVNGQYVVGGLIGQNNRIVFDCYSTGSVNGNENAGGLIGYGTASNSFWDVQTSGLTISAGGIGKTTEEMKNVRTYTDVKWSEGLDSPWDFVGNPYDDKGNEDIWDIDPAINDGYPYLTTVKRLIESTISVEDPAPFDRLFSINLRVKNLDSITISLKITLEERTGFQAGPKYGDGDEIKEITLNPGQEAELTFKAKVYGIQRIGDVARFKFYIGDKLIGQKDQILNLKPEVIEVSTFTSPAAVKKGVSFTIGVPVFYSLSMDTVIALILINEEKGKKIVISDVVKGEGLKIYSIRVNSTIADLNLEGIKSFKLTVQSEYPEENYRVAYKKEFSFKVRVSNDVGSSSIVLDSGLVITLNYKGKQYYALYAYNATPSSPPQSGNIEDSFKWAYSQRNWLVFENIKGSFKPVMDDELYKTLAFAAEIAFLRATIWNNDYLVSRSNFFKDLRDLAIALETLNFIAKVAGKIAGMIALESANSWASSVLSGTESSKLTRDLAMTVKITIEILEKIKLYENVLEAINKVGGAKEEVLVWLSIFLLNGGSDDLIAANKMLPNLTPYQPFVINVSDALTFYSYIQSGETKGLASMRFLSTFYGKDQIDVMGVKISIRPFKGALIEALGFVGTAYEFYENLKNNFNNNEVFEYAQHLASVWMNYEIRKLICQSASLKFRDTYIRETSNSMEISLTEPGTQRKLYLTIYDTEGRIVGFDRKSGNLVAEIPNSYYLDFGNAIIIYVPLNVKIEKVVVDAVKSEQPIENYSLMIQVYKEGNLVSSTSLSSQININTKKEYSLQLTGDLKPILNELTTTPTTPSPSPTITSPTQTLTTSPSAAPLNIELIIIIIVIAAILASLVIVFRKYKAK